MNAQKTLLTLVLLLLCACAKPGSDTASAQSSSTGTPAVFSKWISDDLTTTIDLTGAQFNEPFALQWKFKNGASCSSQINIDSIDESFGTAVISNSSGSIPICSALSGNYYLSYSFAGGEMITCPYPTGICVHYNRAL